MNPCREWKGRLLDDVLGALPAPATREVEMHVEKCAACASALVELRARHQQLELTLAHWVAGAEPPPDFRPRVLAAAEAARGLSLTAPAWAGVLAAVAIVLLAGVLIQRFGNAGTGSTVGPTPSLSSWQSPTETLLRSPAEDFLRAAPRLGESYFLLEPAPADAGLKNGGNNES